jgi:hypothetical protein
MEWADARQPAADRRLRRWVLLCALAETIGMTAAAAAARLAQQVTGDPWAALGIVVGGGLVEGMALGALQAVGLGHLLDRDGRRRWAFGTVLVAGLGWAVASAPAVLGSAADQHAGRVPTGPTPWGLLVAGALGLGLVMGAVLGLVQSRALRGRVRHPGRWVAACATAWPPAMLVIFLGASTPDLTWSTPEVVALGTLTGALAGAALGLVSGAWLESLDGRPLHERALIGVLESPARLLVPDGLTGLRVRGRVSGRWYTLPVMTAPRTDPAGHEPALVVFPGNPASKTWWRNLDRRTPVQVLARQGWRKASATVLMPGHAGYPGAFRAYRTRWPRVLVHVGSPLVLIDLAGDDQVPVQGSAAGAPGLPGAGRTALDPLPSAVNAEGEPDSTKG